MDDAFMNRLLSRSQFVLNENLGSCNIFSWPFLVNYYSNYVFFFFYKNNHDVYTRIRSNFVFAIIKYLLLKYYQIII